jgi:arylsulfatase A-like enzyme
MHHPDGVFIGAGAAFRPGAGVEERLHLRDIAPTTLALLGLPVPRHMEGRVWEELIAPEFLARYPVTRAEARAGREEGGEASAYTDEEAEKVRAHLESLGYLD